MNFYKKVSAKHRINYANVSTIDDDGLIKAIIQLYFGSNVHAYRKSELLVEWSIRKMREAYDNEENYFLFEKLLS